MISKSFVKYIQSLAHKKFREEEGVFVVEGVKMVGELIRDFSGDIVHLIAVQQWIDGHSFSSKLTCPVSIIDHVQLQKISHLTTPNEVLAIVKIPKEVDVHPEKSDLTLVLDQIQDPGNLGTIIRSCDWFGVKNIVCSEDTTDAYNPKTVQSAKGSLMRVNVLYKDLSVFLHAYPDLPKYAAVLGGESIHEVDYKKNAILIIGNEAKGISHEVLSLATEKITIPNKGQAESLNAAVAASIILSIFNK